MKGFKKCNNGHFFKEELDQCPYCPKSSEQSSNAFDKTQISGSPTQHGGDNQKTQVFGTGNPQANPQFGTNSGPQVRDLNKTFIQGMESSDSGDATEKPRASRMITGWIISYTLDSMGQDYRIYEGNNSIGRDAQNTITITKDPAISGHHVTILHKKGKFYIKDEMAANGTFLNGQEIEIGKPYDLNDGDEIKLGNTTVFKFKSAL